MPLWKASSITARHGRDQIITEVLLKDYHGMIRVLNKGKEASAVSNIPENDRRFNQTTVEVI